MSRFGIGISIVIGLGMIAGGCGDNIQVPAAGSDAAAGADGAQDEEVDGGEIALPPLGPGVVTLAGGAEPGNMDGPRGVARFRNPVNLAVDASGMIYVADFDNSLVRRMTPEGEVSTLATEGLGFSRPFGMAAAPDGSIYIQTDFNSSGAVDAGALWMLQPGSDTIELVMDDIGKARGLLVLPDGRLIMSRYMEHVISLLDPATQTISHLAGSPGRPGYRDGMGAGARFDTPYGLALLQPDTVLVADRGNNRLRAVTLGGRATTWAGNGTGTVQDGPLADASFDMPQGLTSDGASTFYVSSMGGHVIRMIANDQVTTIAGNGTPGFADSDNPLEAQFYGLEGIGTSPDGAYLYIADGNRGDDELYHRVRRLSLQ